MLGLVFARGRRKATADLRGDDAPTVVLVLLHGVAKLYHHIIRPDSGLCFELRAVPNLECARAAAREEVGDLLPSEVFLLFEIDK